MAISRLSKFTVPLANDQSASSQGLLMPKLKYRFRATFENFGVTAITTELTKQVVDIRRPSVQFSPITLDVYNSKVYLQGKPEWQETTINFRDDSTGQVAKLIGEQIQKQFDFMEQSSAPSGINYKFRMEFDVLDGGNGAITPNVLEQWMLEGCFLSSVDYGDMAYNSNDPVQIACNIRFDNAVQIIGGPVGSQSVITPTPGDLVTGP
jgi:hypothetical protein